MAEYTQWFKGLSQRGWGWPVLSLLAMGFALWFVLSTPPDPIIPPAVHPFASPFAERVAGIGVVEPVGDIIRVGVQIPGVVSEVCVAAGQFVKKGQLLWTLDSRLVEAEVATLRAQLVSAQLHRQEAQLHWERAQRLRQLDAKAVSEEQYTQRRFAYEKAVSACTEAEMRVFQTQTQQELLQIKAPVDAAVLSVNVRAGEYAMSGVMPEPLMRLGDTRQLWVRVEYDQEYAQAVSKTSRVYAAPRGMPDTQYALQFVRAEPYVRPKQHLDAVGQRVDTRVVQVVYRIENSGIQSGVLPPLHVGQQLDVYAERT